MDSDKIAAYLDEAYPDRPNLFLPEATAPVDTDSVEYSRARQAAAGLLARSLAIKVRC